MTLEEFKKAMKQLKEFSDNDRKFEQAMADFTGGIIQPVNSWREDFEVKLIQKLMDDKYDYIPYFIYEKDWGSNDEYNVYEYNGDLIPLNSLNKLYKAINPENK